jgi:predicted outer membrane repeat protein
LFISILTSNQTKGRSMYHLPKHLSKAMLFVSICMLLFVVAVLEVHAAGVLFVTPAGTGDCSSWQNACSLQSALAAALAGDEIWVAKGTYLPTAGLDRSASFQMVGDVSLYGGFEGTETSLNERNPHPATNGTILSGDIGSVGDNSDNSYHVVAGNDDYTITRIDGFTITGGYANGAAPDDRGGGIYCTTGCGITLVNTIIANNASALYGGGIFHQYEYYLTLGDVAFSGNSSVYGGGMYNDSGQPWFVNVTLNNNSATYGGGIYNGNYGTLIMRNATLSGNAAAYGGGIYSYAPNGVTSELYSVTFSGNTASVYGGGLYNDSSLVIQNAIFWGNTAADGSQVYNNHHNGGGEYIIPIQYSVLQDGCPVRTNCVNVASTDPLLGPFGDHGGPTFTVPIQVGSSAMDNGYDAICPATDQRSVARPQGAHCDIGAYELDATAPSVFSILRADPNPTKAGSVDFTITFSEPVTGVDAADFSLTTSGVTGASITSVSGTGFTYTAAINTGSGTGTLRLDVPGSAIITDLALNPLTGLPYTGGEAYDVRFNRVFIPVVMR